MNSLVLSRDITQSIIDVGLEKAAEGVPLKDVAEAMGISLRSLHKYRSIRPEFDRALRQAREQGYHVRAEMMLTLLEDNPFADIDECRLIFDVNKWYLSKVFSAVYGDRVAVQVESVDISGALSEARARVPKQVNEKPDSGVEDTDPFA